ncbi:MAG: efflux RND transporter periplasmic adaptor subunit [Acidobacteriota bacterium]
MKRWLWVMALAAVAGAGIWWGLRPRPVEVETGVVAVGPLRVTVEEEGKTRLRSRYVITAPVAGSLGRVRLRAGDGVKAGAVVAMVWPPRVAPLDARSVEQGEARVAVAERAREVARRRVAAQGEQVRLAKAEAQYWERQREREERLSRSGDVAAARLERTLADWRRAEATVAAAERGLATAEAEVSAAEAEVVSARAALGQGTGAGPAVAVVAPAGGRVMRVVRESEGAVGLGEALVELGDARAIEVVVEVLSADAVRIRPGMRVGLERWGGAKTLEARVRTVEPGGFTKVSALGVEEQRVRVVADLVSPEGEWAALGDGYRVEAAFVLWEGERVRQVAASAVFRVGEGWAVFVVEGGLARRRAVGVGHRSGLAVEVTGGLREGEVVVLHPDETVEEGKAVVEGKG